jgi:hypothetical protein
MNQSYQTNADGGPAVGDQFQRRDDGRGDGAGWASAGWASAG